LRLWQRGQTQSHEGKWKQCGHWMEMTGWSRNEQNPITSTCCPTKLPKYSSALQLQSQKWWNNLEDKYNVYIYSLTLTRKRLRVRTVKNRLRLFKTNMPTSIPPGTEDVEVLHKKRSRFRRKSQAIELFLITAIVEKKSFGVKATQIAEKTMKGIVIEYNNPTHPDADGKWLFCKLFRSCQVWQMRMIEWLQRKRTYDANVTAMKRQ